MIPKMFSTSKTRYLSPSKLTSFPLYFPKSTSSSTLSSSTSELIATTSTGIIIPDNAQEKPSRGKVVAISSEVEELKIEDEVIFGKYSGNEVTIDDEKYLILDVENIFGIIG